MASRFRRAKKDPVGTAAKAVAYPWKVKSRVDRFLRPAARIAGAAGVAMLGACAVLTGTPAEQWPQALSRDLLPVYWIVSLAVASLLGWTFVADGQKRIRKRVGATAALALFLVCPIAFAILGLV